jgi:TonB family protein
MNSVLILAAVAAAPVAAAPATPPASAPATAPAPRWIVDWAANQCKLVRETGGEQPAALSVQLVPGTDALDLVVVDKNWTNAPLRAGASITVRFDTGETAEATVQGFQGERWNGFVAYGVPADLIGILAKAKSVRVEHKNRPLFAADLPQAAKAVAALRLCEADALRGWGVDPAERDRLRRPAKLRNPAVPFMDDTDYPEEARRQGKQGTSIARLTVEADGKVSECGIASSSGSPALDAQTCAIFSTRPRFDPAIGAEGKPVRSLYVGRVAWRM